MKIGITERGDGGLDQSWLPKVIEGKVDGAVVVTKAPHLLLPLDLPKNVIIHCTITGLGGFKPEPNVESIGTTIAAYEELLERYGSERVVLRIDPIVYPRNDIAENVILAKCKWFENSRLRISFLDAYPHVRERWNKACNKPLPQESFHAPLAWRQESLKSLQAFWNRLHKNFGIQPSPIEVCGEPDIACTGCISKRDLNAMGITDKPSEKKSYQRPLCLCLAEKTELLTNKKQCPNQCVYCYWK